MMEISQDWFEDLKSPLITDQQQQTFVSKHDLELLHKKIIATDLIVQKYQEANRALCRLQSENDDLKQQIEQTTNECCIFSRQVTECTQECDDLKDQIDSLNSENRELRQQLRIVKDENTSNCHEIMVLKQYESLKETNDQLSRTVARQQKNLAKLQRQLQTKSPMVYKPVKNKQEPNETDIALVQSQKSVRELKLALGRLVNFIELSKIEIPIAFHIRPVLKAHDISDNFVETESGFVLKPVKKVSASLRKSSKPVITPVASADDDEDGDNDDYIDVNHTGQPPPVADATATASTSAAEEPSTSSKSSSRRRSKKKEASKPKTAKKSLRQKSKSIPQSSPIKLDDLANKLEFALSQPDQQSPFPSFFSDDDNTEKVSESDPAPVYTPVMTQSATTYSGLRSTITITPKPPESMPRLLSFFSEDNNGDKLPSSSPVFTPVVEERSISTHSSLKPSSRISHVTPMELETMHKPTKHSSCLSEDDDDNDEKLSQASASTSIIEQQQPINDARLSTLRNNVNNDESQPTSMSSNETERISDNVRVQTKTPVNTLDPKHVEIVFHLLRTVTHVPTFFKPLRLVHRRIRQKVIPKLVKEHLNSTEMNINTHHNRISVPIKEQRESIEKLITTVPDKPADSTSVSMDEKNDALANDTFEDQPMQIEAARVNDRCPPITEPSIAPATPEFMDFVSSTLVEKPVILKNAEEIVSPLQVLKTPKQSVLKPFHLSVLSRLLNTLTTLPVKPLVFLPLSTPPKVQRRKSVVPSPSPVLSRPNPCPPTRMQTRSLKSIRACIARCNQPTRETRKRTTTELSSPTPPSTSNAKRMKTRRTNPTVN